MYNGPISIFENSAINNRDKIQCLWSYYSEPRAEVYCLQLNFKISKLAYYPDRAPVAQLVSVGLRTNTQGVKITDEKVLPL